MVELKADIDWDDWEPSISILVLWIENNAKSRVFEIWTWGDAPPALRDPVDQLAVRSWHGPDTQWVTRNDIDWHEAITDWVDHVQGSGGEDFAYVGYHFEDPKEAMMFKLANPGVK